MLLLLLACSTPTGTGSTGSSAPAPMKPATCTLLTVNDTYQIEGLPDQTGGIARLRTLRKQIEKESGPVVVLHAGDMLAPSLPSRTFGGDQMIDSLNRLDGDPQAMDERLVVVFGNHEFDASKEADGPKLDARIEASQFTWLDSSIVWGRNAEGQPIVAAPNLVGTRLVDCQGVKLGIFGLTINSKKAAFVDDFREPVSMARAQSEALRKAGAEVVIGLTHQTFGEDQQLLKTLGDLGPDFIVGGHEHVHMTTNVGR
ncbi:MAG TPA: metallophosphoesterase, partial [Myxococcota bacterium]|nr:metallophosphoesterase [Myxococcota bacterium]